MGNNTKGMLSGIRCIEYCKFICGPYCTKLLADFGAQVIKVEEPRLGDEARRRGPFLKDLPHQERSGLFLYLNTNKLGITLNPETPEGRELFRRLCQTADILVENQHVGIMKELGLDYEALASLKPSLIMTSITPFGQTGPYSNYKSYYLNTFHAGGEGYLIPGGLSWDLYPNREPIKIGGYVGEYDSGVSAAIATLAALYVREFSGKGQHVDVSQQESLLSLCRNEIMGYEDDTLATRATQSHHVAGVFQCKDGEVIIRPNEKHMWDGLLKAMGNPVWARKKRYQWGNMNDRYGHVNERHEATQFIAEWAKGQTKWEVFNKCRAEGCVAGVVRNPAELLGSSQNNERGFFKEIEHQYAGRIMYPAVPYKFSEETCGPTHPAPLLGEHNQEVYCQWLGYEKSDLARLRQAGVI